MLLTDNFLTTSKYWYSGWEREEVNTDQVRYSDTTNFKLYCFYIIFVECNRTLVLSSTVPLKPANHSSILEGQN